MISWSPCFLHTPVNIYCSRASVWQNPHRVISTCVQDMLQWDNMTVIRTLECQHISVHAHRYCTRTYQHLNGHPMLNMYCSSSLVNHHGLERGTLQFVLGQCAHNTLCIHHVCHAVTEHVAVITDTAERSREQWAIDRSRVPVYSFRLRPTQPTGGLQAACHTCVLHSALQVPHDQTHPIG